MSVPDRFHLSIWPWNYAKDVTIASDVAAESAYPLTNMQSQTPNQPTVWDMSADTAIVLTGSSATERAATCWAIHNHTLPSDATARLRLYDGENQSGTEVYDSTALVVPNTIPWGSIITGIDEFGGYFEDDGYLKTHFSRWFDTVTFKSWQIDLSVPTPVNDMLQIDKLWLGFSYCPVDGPVHGTESIIVSPSIHTRKPGGGMDTVEDRDYRTFAARFEMVPNSERHVLRHILDRCKKGGDMLITFDPNDARSQRYELTSIYRRVSDGRFRGDYFNGNSFGLAAEEN